SIYMKKENEGLAPWRALTKVCMVVFLTASIFYAQSGFAQNKGSKYALFEDARPAGTQWAGEKSPEREGGPEKSKQYIYLGPDNSPADLRGVSLRIRENPGPGEYRYVTFQWI